MTPDSSVIRIFGTVRRALLLSAVLGAFGAPLAYAQSGTSGMATEGEPPAVVPENVTVAGVMIGGLTREEARLALRAYFTRPVVLAFPGHRREAPPGALGASVDAPAAVAAALRAAPGEALGLPVRFNRPELRTYVRRLVRAWSRPAVDSTVRLHGLHPFVTRAHKGYRMREFPARMLIRRALSAHERGPLSLPRRVLRPQITRRNFGPVIVIRRGSHGLYLYRGSHFRRSFPIAVGTAQYPTPLGHFHIATMQRNPWWYPPDAAWAAGASPIPPGPGNPLGTRWMGLSVGGVGIHGTPDAASIGYSASHGCIRMRIADAEWLFERVHVGTHVFIVAA
jgi:L,D-transpeptidase catalytic domain